MWRDRWAWASAAAVLPLILHSLGAPLGEPVADDFDYLHRVLFTRNLSLVDGCGSVLWWRPLSRQLYFKLLAPLMLANPALIAALHVALLAFTAVLLYRALRAGLGGPLAALAASFPLLMESTRMLVAWPSNFQDLGAMFFMALALHEAAAARLASTLASIAAALLCKEVAAPVALILPWLPAGAPRDHRRWNAAIAALVAAWGIVYAWIHARAGLTWPHAPAGVPDASWPARGAWALLNSGRAAMSLPPDRVRLDPFVIAAIIAGAFAVAATAVAPAARARLARAMPWAGFGLAWYAACIVGLAPTYPDWLASRGAFAAIGLGVALAAVTGAAHPALAAALFTLRLALFAMSPGPPAGVSNLAVERGSLLDFPKLVRLQRMMRDTRRALHTQHPRLPANAEVGLYNLPWGAQYAFGGDQSLEAWYGDSTLRWISPSVFTLHPNTPLVSIVEFEMYANPCVVLLEPAAMREVMMAIQIGNQGDWVAGLERLARADSLEPDTAARAFRGQVSGVRAVAFAYLGRLDEAEREARRSTRFYPRHPYAHLALGTIAFRRGRLAEADAEVDTILDAQPDYVPAFRLRAAIQKVESAQKP